MPLHLAAMQGRPDYMQVLLENGDITEEEYIDTEAKILRHLREIQERKRELAGAEPRNEEGLSGKVQEGSGASVTFGHQSENDR